MRGKEAAPWHDPQIRMVHPAVLVLLSTVPVVAGAFCLAELSSSATVTPENARFFASSLPSHCTSSA